MSRRRRRALLGLALCIASAIAYAPRVASYLEFRERRSEWGLEGGVVPSNYDAYAWFRGARLVRAGEWRKGERDLLRRHPDGVVRGDPPWISRLIAGLAHWTDGDVYGAGVLYSVGASCLFVVPAFLYGVQVGHPAAGLLAGLVGAASPAVVRRTSVYWVDTDGTNLFALWWIAWASCLVRPDRHLRHAVAAAALAGLSAGLFMGWYAKPGFFAPLFGAFALRVCALRFDPRRVFLLVAVFFVCANPLRIGDAAHSLYRFAGDARVRVLDAGATAPGAERSLPDSAAGRDGVPPRSSPLYKEGLAFVTGEGTRWPLLSALATTVKPVWLAGVGALALCGWFLRAWRDALLLAPMAVLAGYALVGPNRFLMYLAPLLGFGFGVLLQTAARWARVRPAAGVAAVVSLVALAGIALWREPARPRPLVDPSLLASMQGAAEVLPPNPSVWSGFGEGYLIQDVMGAATFSDARPDPVRGHLVMKGLTGADPRMLQRVIAFLEATPRKQVDAAFRRHYGTALEEVMEGSGEIAGAPHLWFAARTLGQFGTRHLRGQWSPEAGWPERRSVGLMNCRRAGRTALGCKGPDGRFERIDLRTGRASSGRRYARIIQTRDGFYQRERSFGFRSASVLIVDQTEGALFVVAAHKGAVESNTLQMFLLGRYDERYFELAFDDFPNARMYRVKRDEGASDPGPRASL